jgi:hypothetical protein
MSVLGSTNSPSLLNIRFSCSGALRRQSSIFQTVHSSKFQAKTITVFALDLYNSCNLSQSWYLFPQKSNSPDHLNILFFTPNINLFCFCFLFLTLQNMLSCPFLKIPFPLETGSHVLPSLVPFPLNISKL